MQPVIEILQMVVVFLGGILARLGVFLAVLALLVLPALAIALVIRAVAARRRDALGIRRVAGFLFRPDVFYAPGHTWLRRRGERRWSPPSLRRIALGDRGGAGAAESGGALELGLDDLAQRLLPSVTLVEVPPPGTSVARGDTVATLHGGGRTVRIPSPVAGTIAGVNAAVLRDPGLVKRDGYARGWLLAISPAERSFADLPQGVQAESWLRRESARWSRFLEDQLGFAAADGGELVSPAPWLVGEEGWKALTAAFLDA
jgi:glycine cleavage system H lipoate-binding protein